MSKTYEELLAFVNDLEIIDTHEHLPHLESVRCKEADFLSEYPGLYFGSDLISAGLKPDAYRMVIDHHQPLKERWDIVEPYWNHCRNTGYGRSLDLSVKALYGIDSVSRANLSKLDAAFHESLKGGHYDKVLRKTSKIKIGLLDYFLDCDKTYFRSVYRLDMFVSPDSRADITWVENETGLRITGLDDWMEASEILLDKVFKAGAVALKSGLAYQRSLCYEKTTRAEAEGEFNSILDLKHFPGWQNPGGRMGKKAQDFMMHHLLRLANKRNLTVQFHTGFHAGNGNIITNSDPSLLSNLFLLYPDVVFDLFHIAYPYQHLLGALAKNFPNVNLNMCWAHIISPEASVRALVEWLDAVPANKISAFGADHSFIDGVAGSAILTRMNVARALACKIEDGVFDIGRACEIAKMLFYDNPMRIYKLEDQILPAGLQPVRRLSPRRKAQGAYLLAETPVPAVQVN
jgi:uncharacterized protein